MLKTASLGVAFLLMAMPVGFSQNTLSPRNCPANVATGPGSCWDIPGSGAAYELPLQGLYVAHLLGGRIASTIEGQTIERQSGSFWIVKTGETMQVKALGEFAVLETIVPTK
jgi:hypothetical protein